MGTSGMVRGLAVMALLAGTSGPVLAAGPLPHSEFCDDIPPTPDPIAPQRATCQMTFRTSMPRPAEAFEAAVRELDLRDGSIDTIDLDLSETCFAGRDDMRKSEAVVVELGVMEDRYTEAYRTLALSIRPFADRMLLRAVWIESKEPWSNVDAAPQPPLDSHQVTIDRTAPRTIRFAIDPQGIVMALHDEKEGHRFFTGLAPNTWSAFRLRAGLLKSSIPTGRSCTVGWRFSHSGDKEPG